MGIIPKWMKFTSGGGYDAISSAYFARMTTRPSADLKRVIDTYFVKNSKTVNGNVITAKSLIAKGDAIYLPVINNSNDSFKNLVKNAHHGTIQGTGLVFDPYWGWNNPNGTGYVDTNYNPATQGVNYKLNDAGIIGLFFNNHNAANAYYMGAIAPGSVNAFIRKGTSTTFNAIVNSSQVLDTSAIPFQNGLFGGFRTSETTVNSKNQNIVTSTAAKNSNAVPPLNIYLFGINSGNQPYYQYSGGINFFYIGASLTDDEFTALNLIVNEFLKECLYIKYGADNWGVKMAKSYFDTLHNFEPYEAWEIYEFIKRHQPDYVDSAGTGYLYNTFGANGQSKTVCDYLMLFKAGGNLAANAWTKTGATLRWNQDGTITTSNTMPAYTRGSNLGIVTVTSTDGWNGVTAINLNQTVSSVNSFYGNFPLLEKIKTSGAYQLTAYQNRIRLNFLSPYNLLSRFLVYNCSNPCLIRYNINNVISGAIDNLRTYANTDMAIEGDFSQITNQITSQLTIDGVGSQRFDGLVGGLQNLAIPDTMQFIYVARSGIVAGTSTWNKNCMQLTLSNCRLSTSAVDNQLKVINDYFAINTPIKNLTVNLSGTTMGIPTGGANNTDLLGIIAKHAAAGFTATITVRTS